MRTTAASAGRLAQQGLPARQGRAVSVVNAVRWDRAAQRARPVPPDPLAALPARPDLAEQQVLAVPQAQLALLALLVRQDPAAPAVQLDRVARPDPPAPAAQLVLWDQLVQPDPPVLAEQLVLVVQLAPQARQVQRVRPVLLARMVKMVRMVQQRPSASAP